MPDNWQAAQARSHFSEIVDAAVEGRPQFIRRRDGNEVVVVSRDYFDSTKMDLKTYLLTAGYAGDEPDAFDEAMRDVRSRLPPIAPRSLHRKD
jgi:prevent-host-death family protein